MKRYLKIISDLLTEKKIEKQEFAKMIEKTPQTISNYFSEKSVIDIETFIKIANVLEVPVAYFFSEEGFKTEARNLTGEADEIKKLRSENSKLLKENSDLKSKIIKLLERK